MTVSLLLVELPYRSSLPNLNAVATRASPRAVCIQIFQQNALQFGATRAPIVRAAPRYFGFAQR